MRVFIGCSANENIPKKYVKDCSLLIKDLMRSNDLVFGAFNLGLMGIAHDIAKANDRDIIGICPERYADDFKDLSCTEEIVTETVSRRTDKLIEEADALVFLPGGIGTVYEFFSAVEAKKCHEIDKPIVLYNSQGFYDELLVFMNKQLNENFYRPNEMIPFKVLDDSYDVLEYINLYSTKDGDILYNKSKVRTLK